MRPPKILVIDDQFGQSVKSRRDLCAMYGIQDVTGDDSQPEEVGEPLAEAVFCSGQIISGNTVTNDVELTVRAAEQGWPLPGGGRWALVLLDLCFVSGSMNTEGWADGQQGDEAFGLEILGRLRELFPELPVVILSSRERKEVIDDCRSLGAADFIQRHASLDSPSPREILAEKLREYGLLEDDSGVVIGRSISLLKALAAARRAATGGGNILILGESGTGKELLARYIHDHSPKAKGPYKVFHAFGTAENLQEDLLFGHVKGAFTDAKKERRGLFEQASSGTLFIDEVGDIPETLQNKLLRPIEMRQVSRQGSDEEIDVDVQLVLATNKALDDYAATGCFKFDLLNRIRAYTIKLPPLRERREDIPLLVNQLLEGLCREHNSRWPRTIHLDAMEKLKTHDWREGNVRELRNVLERVVKDNKDSEIVVVGDIRFDTMSRAASVPVPEPDVSATGKTETELSHGDWLAGLHDMSIDHDYAFLHGSWPSLQREIALLLARYLVSAIEVTRKRRADGPPEGEINMTGAVSCLLGRQIPTVKAADFVKRLLQFGEETGEEIIKAHPSLETVLEQALRYRPKKAAVKSRGES